MFPNFNNEKNLPIDIKLDKVCYFPEEVVSGTVTLSPRLEVFEPLMDNPEITVILDEYQCYTYSSGSGKNRTRVRAYRKNNLIETKISFKDYMKTDYSPKIEFPFSVTIPKEAYPSLCFNDEEFIRHF